MGAKAYALRALIACVFVVGGVPGSVAQSASADDKSDWDWGERDIPWVAHDDIKNWTDDEPRNFADEDESEQDLISLVGFEPLAEPDLMQDPPPLSDPVPFSRPTPFQIATETPPAGNNQNFYSGNPPVQDLSRLLPGKYNNTKYKWYGFVRIDAIFDQNPIASTDSFVTSAIPVPQGRGQNTAFTPRYTRLGFDTETPWDSMGWTIKTRIEIDFFNGNTSGSFGSFPPRLRFAWADFGPFLIGQAASLFMDYDAFPNVLDYQGPPGMVLMRQPIVAVRLPVGERFKVSMGAEQPYSDIQWFEGGTWDVNPGSGIITTPGVGRNVQDMPDFTGNIRYAGDYGHVQLAGIGRKLTYQPPVGSSDNVFGYGANLSGTWHPWGWWNGCAASDAKTPMDKSRFLAQYAAGRGINRYFQDTNGLGLDATFDPVNGFRALTSTGWFVAYEQWWAERWASNFTLGGSSRTELTNTLPDNTFMQSTYYTSNLVWFPVERMGVGCEYIYGSRQNKDGQSGYAHRVQLAFQYKF